MTARSASGRPWPRCSPTPANKDAGFTKPRLLAFYDFSAEHWIHLRTTNPIESTFVIVRLRTTATKDAGSRAAGLAMVFRLVESAQARWAGCARTPVVALVCAGARFERGRLVERPETLSA